MMGRLHPVAKGLSKKEFIFALNTCFIRPVSKNSVDIHSPVSENLMAPLVLMPIKSCATHPRSIEEKLRHILHVEKYGNLRKNEEEHHEQLLLTKSILSLPKQREQQQQHTREQRVYCPSSSRGSSQHNTNSTNNALLTLLRLSLKQQQIASGTNQGAIDNRIEQAMDLVKSHLMNAVRSEVEELKERIVKLEDVISHLQTENDFLKANVTQEVLTQLPPPTAHHQILQQQGPNAPVSAAPAGSISPIASPLILSSQQQQQPL